MNNTFDTVKNYGNQAWEAWMGTPEQTPASRVPEVIRHNTYLAVQCSIAAIKCPKHVLLGIIMACFLKAVAKGAVSSQLHPLAERLFAVMKPVLEGPMTVPDMCVVFALLAFADFAPFASIWVGFKVGMIGLQTFT